MMRAIFYSTAGLILSAAAAHASCGTLSLSSLPNPSINWSESFTSQQINFTFQRTGSGSCDARASFSDGGASTYTSRRAVHTHNSSKTISYQLYKTSSLSATQILKQPPDTSSTNELAQPSTAFSGSVGSRSGAYHLAIPYASATSPTIAKAGTYTDQFTMHAYDGTNIDNSYTVTLTINVPVITNISLVSTGGAFNAADVSETLNFSVLAENATRSFDLRVETNAGYEIKFTSQNNGVMKHLDTSVTTTIPYTVTVNSTAYSLVGSNPTGIVVATSGEESGLAGINNPVTFKIGNVANKVAGSYQDVITVTASTLD